ncbi:hypothetical protein JYB88_15505 [Shewanella cyperi]|uniref:Uncharacterized protein n=1 Tax=Shewanella cyperi TaxID=2814292 RepID=A0A974XJL4_9GAMM|nr:hypothetical protein [Shewanella cyperi]QSX29584.1 hypothetical protein JYB88_15505 [Shewanella cyperi]
MICSHCHKALRVSAISHQRGKGLKAQIQCPHCGAWLGRSPVMASLKLGSFYLGLLSASVAWWQESWRQGGTLLAIMCLIALLCVHLMDQLKVVEAPPAKPDDSHERQKYR